MPTFTCTTTREFKDALAACTFGDTITLQAGNTFTGTFTLPKKGTGTETGWISIQSSALASLPAGTRVSPSDAVHMPTILTPGANGSAIVTAAGAHHWKLLGLEVKPLNALPATAVSDIIRMGDGSNLQNALSLVPHDMVIDRCYIHGNPTQSCKRGIALNSASTDITNCYIEEIHVVGQDNSAIGGWNGPGPYNILNNYLCASCENILFGGANAAIPGCVPSNIVVKNNHMYKPLSWKYGDPSYAGIMWDVKNLFEIKSGSNVTIDSNIFENCWVQGQTGNAISLKCADTGGATPWVASNDITFTNNVIINCGLGLVIAGQKNVMHRITIKNNLWQNISNVWASVPSTTPGGAPRMAPGDWFQISGATDVVIDHNTADFTGKTINLPGPKNGADVPGLTFTENVGNLNTYGVIATSALPGVPSLLANAPNYTFAGNLLYGGTTSLINAHPQGNQNVYPASLPTDVGGRGYNGTTPTPVIPKPPPAPPDPPPPTPPPPPSKKPALPIFGFNRAAGVLVRGFSAGGLGTPIVYPALIPGQISVVSAGVDTLSLSATEATGGIGPFTHQWSRSLTQAGPYVTVGDGSLSLSDMGLSPNTTYYYRLAYTDSVGQVASAWFSTSTTVDIVIAPAVRPIPVNLIAGVRVRRLSGGGKRGPVLTGGGGKG